MKLFICISWNVSVNYDDRVGFFCVVFKVGVGV